MLIAYCVSPSTIEILHASSELDRLRKVTFVRYLYHVSPDTLVILGEDRSRIFDFGWTRRRRACILRFFLRWWHAFSSSIIGRRRFIPAFDGRCRRRDRLTLDRLVQHAHSVRQIRNNVITIQMCWYLRLSTIVSSWENFIFKSSYNYKNCRPLDLLCFRYRKIEHPKIYIMFLKRSAIKIVYYFWFSNITLSNMHALIWNLRLLKLWNIILTLRYRFRKTCDHFDWSLWVKLNPLN